MYLPNVSSYAQNRKISRSFAPPLCRFLFGPDHEIFLVAFCLLSLTISLSLSLSVFQLHSWKTKPVTRISSYHVVAECVLALLPLSVSGCVFVVSLNSQKFLMNTNTKRSTQKCTATTTTRRTAKKYEGKKWNETEIMWIKRTLK